ncbi:MAG: hypothetical protein ACK53L_31895, partial [Pirellulaceae bacterium]
VSIRSAIQEEKVFGGSPAYYSINIRENQRQFLASRTPGPFPSPSCQHFQEIQACLGSTQARQAKGTRAHQKPR